MKSSEVFWHTRDLVNQAGLLQTTRLATSLTFHLMALNRLKRGTRQPIVVISLLERLGDIVACEPIITQVRLLHPGAAILWCTSPSYREVLKNHPDLSDLIIVRSLTEWRALAKLFPFDAIYDLHPNGFPCHIFSPHFKKKYGNSIVRMENYYNFPGGLLGSLSKAGGLPLRECSPRLFIPENVKKSIDRLALPREFAVAHTRSEESSRDWRSNHWRRLQRELAIPLIEVGRTRSLESKDGTNMVGRLSILQTAEVIRRAQFFIGVDSGPAHLAHAVRTPGIILLGSFKNFRKYNPYVGYYQKPPGAIHVRVNGPASEIPYSMVWKSVVERIETLGIALK